MEMVGVGMALWRKGVRRRDRRVKRQNDGDSYALAPSAHHTCRRLHTILARYAGLTLSLLSSRDHRSHLAVVPAGGRGYYDIIIGGPKLEPIPPLATLALTRSRNGQLREMQPHQLPEPEALAIVSGQHHKTPSY